MKFSVVDEDVCEVAQRIREEFRAASLAINGKPLNVTLSVGVASLLKNQPSGAEQLVGLADVALYQAKQGGRDRIICAEPRTAPSKENLLFDAQAPMTTP